MLIEMMWMPVLCCILRRAGRADVPSHVLQGTWMVDMHRHDGLLGALPQEQPGSTAPVSVAASEYLPEQLPRAAHGLSLQGIGPGDPRHCLR